MRLGDWVVLKNLNYALNGKEGKIIEKTLSPYSKIIYLKVLLESGRIAECTDNQVILTKKNINYSELINMALDMHDKDWFKDICSRLNEPIRG